MIECRGRNGWFIFSGFNAYVGQEHSYVSIYSRKTPTNIAPIYFTGPLDRIIKLFEDILSELKSQQQKKDKTDEIQNTVS